MKRIGNSLRAVLLCTAVGLLVIVGAGLLGAQLSGAGRLLLGPAARRADAVTVLTTAITALAGLALEATLIWAWLVSVVVGLETLGGRPTRASGAVPEWARRVVLVACGLVVVSAAPGYAVSTHPSGSAGRVTASARPPAQGGAGGVRSPHDERVETLVIANHWGRRDPGLSGLPYPDRAPGGWSPHPDIAGPGRAGEPTPAPDASPHVTVAPGDTLWSLVADRLGPGAGDEDVAEATHHLYLANRVLIGDDPDLIRPGQRLRLPPAGGRAGDRLD